jgi:hypothetical protein
MRTWMKVLLGIVAAIAVAIGLVIYATNDMSKTAEAFFTAVKANDTVAIQSQLSANFKQAVDEARLAGFIKTNGIDRFKSASWGGRSVNTSGGVQTGELDGSITLDDGGLVPIKIKFIKEGGAWKILSLEKAKAGISEDGKSAGAGIPANDQLVRMVNDTTQVFGRSLRDKSMQGFYGYISQVWQQQISVDALNKIFKPFIDAELDLSGLKGISPVFDTQPALDDNGVLIVKGYYPSKPLRVLFTQKYVLEGSEWKLLGINVNAKPADAPAEAAAPTK